MAAPNARDLVLGQFYFSAKCASCGEIIPLHPAGPSGEGEIVGTGTMKAGCPFCGKTHSYEWSTITARKLRKMPPTPH